MAFIQIKGVCDHIRIKSASNIASFWLTESVSDIYALSDFELHCVVIPTLKIGFLMHMCFLL